MADENLPFRADEGAMIRFEQGGQAPVLSYDVPQPSEYTGRHFLELVFDDKVWNAAAQPGPYVPPGAPPPAPPPPPPPPPPPVKPPRPLKPSKTIAADQLRPDLGAAQDLLGQIVADIPKDVRIPPLGPPPLPGPGGTGPQPLPGLDQLLDLAGLEAGIAADILRPREIARLDELVRRVGAPRVVAQVRRGASLVERRTLDNRTVYNLVAPPDPALRKPRIAIAHVCRLSSYLGEYGAGRTISTFSLLPGEQHQIEIKTYRRTKQTTSEASSILDSFEETTADEFQDDLTSENSTQNTEEENFTYQAQAEGSATWGWGKASATAGVSGSTTGHREEFAKNVASTTQKHAATAASKRQVEVNTTSQTETEEGEERAVKRTIQNINVGRTLNFVFRQMNQVFVTVLSIVDVRIAFRNGDPADEREYALPQLDELLRDKVTPAAHAEVAEAIWQALRTCFDWQGNPRSLVEALTIEDAPEGARLIAAADPRKADFWRFPRQSVELDSLGAGAVVTVPGVVIGVTRSTLPTDGVVVDALLGQGNALDAYSMGLQMAAVEERQLANTRAAAEAEVVALKLETARAGDKARAELIAQMFAAPGSEDDGGG